MTTPLDADEGFKDLVLELRRANSDVPQMTQRELMDALGWGEAEAPTMPALPLIEGDGKHEILRLRKEPNVLRELFEKPVPTIMVGRFLVYLAGPITGVSYAGCTSWRDYATQLFADEPEIRCLSPMRNKQYLAGEEKVKDTYKQHVLSCDRGIMTRDRNDVRRSHLVLVNLLGATEKSTGTILEMGWAWDDGTPVVCAMEEAGNPHDHSMLRETIGFRVTTLEDAVQVAKHVLLP